MEVCNPISIRGLKRAPEAALVCQVMSCCHAYAGQVVRRVGEKLLHAYSCSACILASEGFCSTIKIKSALNAWQVHWVLLSPSDNSSTCFLASEGPCRFKMRAEPLQPFSQVLLSLALLLPPDSGSQCFLASECCCSGILCRALNGQGVPRAPPSYDVHCLRCSRLWVPLLDRFISPSRYPVCTGMSVVMQ